MTDEQFTSWLKNPSALRCVLMEVKVQVGGVETTRYLSNKGYTTGGSDVPAHTAYEPIIVGGVQFTESISLDGSVSLSFGDIELQNSSGERDSWLEDVWKNRDVNVFIGDVRWPRSDFRQIFSGIVADIGTRRNDRLNISLTDKLQRLNTPISEAKLGGETQNKDQLIPLTFGEVHNVTPLLVSEALHEYQVHDGPIESIIEVRDNGVPVSITPLLSEGKFRLNQSPYGTITCSVQGDNTGGYTNNVADIVRRVVERYGKVDDRFNHTETLSVGYHPVQTLDSVARPSVATYTDVYGVLQTAAANVIREDHDITQPLGDGTYASRGYLIEAAATNLIQHSTDFTHSSWSKTAGGTGITPVVTPNAATAPDGTLSADRIVFDKGAGTTSTDQSNMQASVATVTGQPTVAGIWIRSATADTYLMRLDFNGGGSTNYPSLITVTPSWTFFPIYLPSASDTVRRMHLRLRGTNGTSNYADVYVWGAQQEVGVTALSSYIPTNGAAATRAADIAKVHKDIDLDNFSQFAADNVQPVGIYLDSRTNVLEVGSKLAKSVGAGLSMNREGYLRLIKIALPVASSGSTVTSSDIIKDSLQISSRPPVVASVKLGYCQNYTVQDDLQTGIPTSHKDLFEKDYLTVTKTDSAVAAKYKLFTEPAMTETLLLTEFDANAEAQRRLDLYKVQRTIYKFTALPHLILESTGNSITLDHWRFGLEGGKSGQIISLTTNWLNPRIDMEVLT